jgi:SpoVK/Ycf46/Vps4 family AAA+-type ATPase
MGLFLDKLNPGMRRRFKHYLSLPDYTAEELLEIFEKSNVQKGGYILTPEAREAAKKAIDTMVRKKQEGFGNAGAVRIFFEEAKARQSSRVAALSDEERTLMALNTLEAVDIGEPEKTLSVDDVLADLDKMVGMTDVKQAVRGIATKLAHQKLVREQTGKAPEGEGNNICITGNPGTGKTTIVRTLSKLFKAIGLLPTDKLIEIQGNDLKGSYIGQSKDQVNEYCRQAMGGVLFIDEAYSLSGETGPVDQFAQEAIDVLMAHLENDRDRFVGIVAGYPKEMDIFIQKSNPGMARRFTHYLKLPDYTADELIEIFERFNVAKAGFTMTDGAKEKAREAIRQMVANKGPTFGNAGAVRSFFEQITTRQASRVMTLSEDKQLEGLQIITEEDIG